MTSGRSAARRLSLPLLLLALGLWTAPGTGQEHRPTRVEKQRYDGWYNNMAHPNWGSTEQRLTRKTPPSYSDGVYMMAGEDRPSPRKLSRILMRGKDGMPSTKNRTALLVFFGQVVSSEILMASEMGCPIEMHKIRVEQCDEMYDADCSGEKYMPFYRAGYDSKTGQSPNMPREQINSKTSWIDGSFIYSTSEAWLNTMRSFENGTFRTDENGMPPKNHERVPIMNKPSPHLFKTLSPERMYLLGDERTNQNPALLSLGILFFRWHNKVALRAQEEHPDWSDEEVFQRARRIVVATLQNIIMYEYLPAFLGDTVEPYKGYRADVHPGISHVFQSAAFRFGHSMIPPGLYRRDNKCNYKRTISGDLALRLCSTWWDSNDVLETSTIEELLMGMSSQIAEREDAVLCSDVRDKLFGPMEFSRRDLGALNIMRGRDNGLPDYNTVRKCFQLPIITNLTEANPELAAERPELFKQLMEAYGDQVMNIDLYVGGMLESRDGPGELFRAIIKEQFQRLRDADRFWFENTENGIFTETEVAAIKRVHLYDIILSTTSIKRGDLQENVFFHMADDPCPQPKQLNASQMEPCRLLSGHDYFQGNEVTYIYACIFLAAVPLLTMGAAYGVVKLQNRKRRRYRMKQEENNNGRSTDKMFVTEWLHQNHRRNVKIKFGPDVAFHTVNRKGVKLRTARFNSVETVVVEVTEDRRSKPMCLVRVPNDHDVVLDFDSVNSRKRFLAKLEHFLAGHHKTMETVSTYKEQMLQNADTKERRQKRLEHFFREAYSLSFGHKPGEKKVEVSNDIIMVMRTSLTKREFASALGMKADSVFVQKMFNVVDKDGDGQISFQEFLETVELFSRGTIDNKLRIIFDMCDNDRNGTIDKDELSEMLRSLVEIAKTNSLTDEQVDDLIDGMFRSAGLEEKDVMTYEDFKLLMKEFKGDLVAIGLDCKGAKQNFLDTSTNIARMPSVLMEQANERREHWFWKRWDAWVTFLEENRQNIFYLFLFYVITVGLFVERFAFYSFQAEHTDLRHVMGVGIAITRGSAASLSFCYSLLLLTMSRNILTMMKNYSIQQYLPIDSHIQFHKIVACTSLFFTVLHSIGHLVNFYHVSTQSLDNLRCLLTEMTFQSDARPGIGYWLFCTLTGTTGIILYCIVMIIYIFAHPLVRKRAYKYFWYSHSLYYLLYIFSLIHGLARLTGAPRFWMFFVGPAVVYTFDKIISLRTKYMELDIIETELLPGDVLKVKFYRPPNFQYHSGEWVRVRCTAVSHEYHSFTLTSAPHENFLSLHIKAQGPWTWKLRNFFDPINYIPEENGLPPRIRLEGPFGGGNQDWYKFEVAVMVGGGIGVTPYASILNDLVFGTSTNRYSGVSCKKVYFLWICPSHKSFEWFIDVLRDVEKKDVTQVLEMHIFITQFFHKFDLRTTMLYICENHFQRLSNRSMFTGLKAVNHFGRPDMASFFKFIQKKHNYVSKIGVFSCGPRPLTKSVSTACDDVNKGRKQPYFIHHFENFG
ncbi:dual oxidase-like [Amphibalanus amphitrite]|uniref:dual oxidase-like n=1 Tax=Amphibalanus amphitrite TaxID=1232801 RepID=UPI001C9273F7|nr:dual oxidase-like [Amphibalanus amphitrite]